MSMSPRSLEIQDSYSLSQLPGTHRPLSKVNPWTFGGGGGGAVDCAVRANCTCKIALCVPEQNLFLQGGGHPSTFPEASRTPVSLHLVRPRVAWGPEGF